MNTAAMDDEACTGSVEADAAVALRALARRYVSDQMRDDFNAVQRTHFGGRRIEVLAMLAAAVGVAAACSVWGGWS